MPIGWSLRECPWCRRQPSLHQDQDGSWYVACTFHQCPVAPLTAGYSNRHLAAKMWNCEGLPDLIPVPVGK